MISPKAVKHFSCISCLLSAPPWWVSPGPLYSPTPPRPRLSLPVCCDYEFCFGFNLSMFEEEPAVPLGLGWGISPFNFFILSQTCLILWKCSLLYLEQRIQSWQCGWWRRRRSACCSVCPSAGGGRAAAEPAAKPPGWRAPRCPRWLPRTPFPQEEEEPWRSPTARTSLSKQTEQETVTQ